VAQPQAVPAAVGVPAAVHRKCVAVDITARSGVGQVGHRGGDVLRVANRLIGHPVDDVGVGVAARCLVGMSIPVFTHLPAADGVDPDAAAAPLGSQGAG